MRHRWYGRHVVRRLPMLMAGLVLFGFAIAALARSQLGLAPWETLNQGIAVQTGLPMGTVAVLLGFPILLLWWPLGERPGIGTVLNLVTVGTSTNVGLSLIPTATELPVQVALFAVGLVAYAVATGMYLSTDLGPGPRDGLMTGVHHRSGWPIRYVRTGIELTVLVAGFALGGTVGIGTVIFALTMGPLTELSLRVFDREGRVMRRRIARDEGPLPIDGVA